jgi:hypothetical protein
MPFTNTSSIEKVVYNVVVNWLADEQDENDNDIQNNLDWTLTGAPPNGYSMQPQTYTKMCNDISAQIQKTLGRAVNLNLAWRNKNRNDTVNAFIAAVTIEIVKAKLTNIGKGAVKWSITK